MAKVILILILFLSGCAAQVRTEYVKAPQVEPPVITRPDLDTDYITPDMNPGEVIQAHRLTIKKLQAWGLELEQALKAYSNQGPQTSK